tara:strand:+ start:200 stop:313 length:114 start_codon:yes stop_codon:yes gene_type:complete
MMVVSVDGVHIVTFSGVGCVLVTAVLVVEKKCGIGMH